MIYNIFSSLAAAHWVVVLRAVSAIIIIMINVFNYIELHAICNNNFHFECSYE